MRPLALITGASSGIGAATALALAGSHRLILTARRRDRLDALVARIIAAGGSATDVACDLARDGAVPALVAAVHAAGRLDVLVNNAGVFTTAATGGFTPAHLDELWRLDLRAPMLLTAALLDELAASRGVVINVSSMAADAAFAGCGAYSAMKAGLEAWSRALREELRASGVRVGVVAPGATDTEAWPSAAGFDRSRMCRAEDVAAAIALMATMPASASIDRVVVAPPGGAL
ncbi:MAG TPA: SDR family NAD(P)-dependent oxidoreductase [Planctomycetota bacterium]|nr:SDR family NAD(P)-dependent oxidoreductase [Planctomycetota bacterium]